MTSPPARTRLEVALPAIVMFVFGLGSGIVIGYAAGPSRQVDPEVAPRAGEAQPASEQAEAQSPDEDPAVLKQRLDIHLQLLEKNPEDVRLLRTVGNYHGMLGQQDEALGIYAKAETLARSKGEASQLVEILTDQAVALTENGQLGPAFAKLDEAQAAAPQDTRSRLTAAVILLTRVMPSPPPGFDRKEAVTRAESLLREVLVIQPNEPNALEMLSMIESIRASMGRSGQASAPAP